MTTISIFTPVSYERPCTFTESTLSILSHYFSLGGLHAKVINKNDVQLESKKVSWSIATLKVISYISLFPFTLSLLGLDLGLRYFHTFTVISPSSQPEPIKKVSDVSQSILTSSSSKPNLKDVVQTEKKSPPVETKSASETPQVQEKTESISFEAFKKKVKDYFTHKKSPDDVAQELFKDVPEKFELTDLVDFIFKNTYISSTSILLNAILIAYPSFNLSPYDTVRKAIVEDKDHLITNNQLIDQLKADNNLDKLSDCYDLAYRLNHPYLYPEARTPIPTSDYSLNFLWLNLNPQDRINDRAENIFKDGLDLTENDSCIKDPKLLRTMEENEKSLDGERLEEWEKIKATFAYRISKWADVNPCAQMNLWYDSALVTQKAQQKTFEMMRDISATRGVDIRLRDIRHLSNLNGEIENVFHPATQIYYRVDLLKALIADHMMSSPEESAKYCVVSDIDVEPMSSRQTFDQRTVDYLSKFGYIFNRVGVDKEFENNFFIFNKTIEDFQKDIQENIQDDQDIEDGNEDDIQEDIYIANRNDLRKIHNETIIQEAASMITKLRTHSGALRQSYILGAESIYVLYQTFRNKMGETYEKKPRKIVKSPESQFNSTKKFTESDYQKETFRFIGNDNTPYTINGRNYGNGESQIERLKNWKPEPLPLIK